ncbi:MAG: DUF1415 domain-containing protein [Burkholderiaceae bacterium]
MNPDLCLFETRAWVRRAVVGLNLCPFAKAPLTKGLIRYVVSVVRSPDALLAVLADELAFLVSTQASEVETTLLVHPLVFTDFTAFNDFIGDAEEVLSDAGLEGILQIASFHPQYQFAGTAVDDLGNATNRSPYPTLHLLREASIDRAVDAFPDPAAIFSANISTLQALGDGGWKALQDACRRDAADESASAQEYPRRRERSPGRPVG